MPNRILIDNWTLQSVGELFSEGMCGDTADEMEISPDRSNFGFREVSADVINVSALFQILTHLVFCDELFVDDGSTNTWEYYDELSSLSKQHLIIPKPFRSNRSEWLPARDRIVEELCVCRSMSDLHSRNVTMLRTTGKTENPVFSQVIWGGAGMLARADVLNIPYATHPLRESCFSQVDALFGSKFAHEQMTDFVNEQRVKVANRIDSSGYLAKLNFPPVAALIVQEAKTASDLLPLALQFRSTYSPLRAWLVDFQQALESGDTVDVLARGKLFDSVARHVESKWSTAFFGDTSIQVGLSWLKGTVKVGSHINSMRNRFGVRAMLNRLILGSQNKTVLTKLCKLFDAEFSRVGVDFRRDYLSYRAEQDRLAPQ